MKTIFATLIAFGLFAGAASAGSNPFTSIRDAAPRAPFDQIQDTAPRTIFDDIRDTSPRSDGVFGDLETNAP